MSNEDHSLWDPDLAEEDPNVKRRRNYVATKNNYTDGDIAAIAPFAEAKCSYLVFGREIGEKGTPHLQLYFELNDAMSYSAVHKKLFKCWMGSRKGSPKCAAGYCKKGDGPKPKEGYEEYFHDPHASWDGEEFGQISEQGKRTELDAVCEAIVGEKQPMKSIAMEFPVQFVKFHKGLAALRAHVIPERKLDAMPEVIVRWGESGTGKSEGARMKHWPGIAAHVWEPSHGPWWDNYDGEDKVIMEEFRGQMPFADLLSLLDKYACRRPIKGGFVNIVASKFVITSPLPPKQWYKDLDEYDRYAQLERRITKVIHCKKDPFYHLRSVTYDTTAPVAPDAGETTPVGRTLEDQFPAEPPPGDPEGLALF